MRKSYSLVKLFDGVTNMSDLTRKIADLTYWTRQLPSDADVTMVFEGKCFELKFDACLKKSSNYVSTNPFDAQ